ncbi:MAG: DNA recombination protein RmuC [Candidatus Gastranaerophilales bacterium]|nr:DNA recombination protein RmuC [Candidatus Gastranaerophilales bacterium]
MEIAVSFIFGAIISGVIVFIIFSRSKNKLKERIIKLESELNAEERRRNDEKNLAELIKKEFSFQANEILLEKQKNLQEQNKASLETFLNPLKEKIKEFQQKVEQADETGKINTATIKEKIEDLVKQNRLVSDMTEKLSLAISQNSKYRGNLGEMILEKLLKASGLIDKKENPLNGNFETQTGFKSLDGSGGTKIIDAVIYLSEGQKSVVIDSKAPLAEFINFTQSDNQDEAQKHLNAFMNDVYDRIKELSGKYTNLDGLQTPDFTIMFIPFEHPLTYIYSNNRLIEDALKQNIIIAGPSTLIATLRTINYSWAQKNQYENIKDISKLGNAIYEKCMIFIQKIEGVQTSFETVKKKFEDTFKTLKGRGGLLFQVEKLKEYGISPSNSIDSKYLETSNDYILSGEE